MHSAHNAADLAVSQSVTGTVTGQIELLTPSGSGQFGTPVMLTNGNFVVADPFWDNGATADVGAVYLYNGTTLALISRLTGSTADDRVGQSVEALPNGNFVVLSPRWDNGGSADVGAVTWVNGSTGLSGTVSTGNSLYGTSAGDQIGVNGLTVHPAGYYVVGSPLWDSSGAITDAGAVTWVDGGNGHPYNESGPGAAVSGANSLVGGSSENFVGSRCSGSLSANGCLYAVYTNESSLYADNPAAANYQLAGNKMLIGSPYWDDPDTGTRDVGAVTLMPATGMAGIVTSANSLVGSNESDNVGTNLAVLANGNYVVRVPGWDLAANQYDVGAVIWGDAAVGITGQVTTTNALHGTTFTAQPVNRPLDADRVGSAELLLLTNGNYVVVSPRWNLTSVITNTGAVTWVDGSNGHPAGASSPGAAVSVVNSLVGSQTQDQVGGSIRLIGQGDSNGVAALSNGNYVVGSAFWANGAVANAGAATWGNGTIGITGTISSANSLVGATADDQVGSELVALVGNGNYVVVSPNWDNGSTANVGAVTWSNGANGITGVVSSANSLVGTTLSDSIGSSGVQALRNNGNYVVLSPNWDNGATTNVGAVTWANGATGLTGPVTTANSLYGSTAGDQVGSEGDLQVNLLTNGNFVVGSSHWDNGAATDAGAATWINGATGTTGPVSAANSLVGSHTDDKVGKVGDGGFSYAGVKALSDGNYIVAVEEWNSFIGAVAWGNGATGTSGTVSNANALVGVNPGDLLLGGEPRILPNGQYVVVADAGSATWSRLAPGLTGPIGEPDTVFFGGTGGAVVRMQGYSELLDILAVSRPADNKVTIMFPAYPVTVTLAGPGSGAVTSNVVTSTLTGSPNSQFWPEQIDCGVTCTAHVRVNNVITLTATPNPGSDFIGWSGGGCSGTGDCVVTADAAKDVTAAFDLSLVEYVQSCRSITFDADAAGFRTASTNANRAVVTGPFAAPYDTNGRLFQWEATGGNLDGHLRADDLDTEYQEVWTPVPGDSDFSSLIGRRLGFDYRVESNFNQFRLYVSVKGNNGNEYYFYFNDQLSAPNTWDRVSVPLDAAQWHTGFEAGENPGSGPADSPAPSEADFLAVLSDLAHIAISVEGVQGFDTTRLDNIGGDCDRGDAPASYGDPVHVIASSPALQLGSINGVVVDGEPFLQASTAADGDDNNKADDENGVTTLEAFFGQLTARIGVYPDINDPNATPGNLCAWVDGSGPSGVVDGVFDSAEGQCVNVQSACFSNFIDANFSCDFTWDISNLPANSETFVRFRVTNDALTTADSGSGLAGDGEVEDYRVVIRAYDSGDAPGLDRNNPTDVDGIPRQYGRAPHVFAANPTFYLGTVPPDVDTSFLGGVDANGDDADGIDDEEGASFTVGLGVTAQITVTNDSGSTKVLEGFVDGQQTLNGVFGLGEEREVTVPASGSNAACQEISTSPRRFVCSLSWDAGALSALKPGTVTFARIRLSTSSTGNSTDTKPDGEVEDYRIDVPFNDVGDAPKSYGDAVHTLDNNLYIGATAPDAETQPLHSTNADGDDLKATDDEDGLSTLPALYTGDTGYSLTGIPVFNNTGSPATLYGWVDFNRNGTFDSGEGTSVNVPVSAAAQTVDLTWGGLSGTVAGQSYVRLRLATQTGLGATGFTDAGEVEDYALTIVQSGSLVVVKNAAGGDASFPFTGTSPALGSFVLTTTNGAAQRTFANLVPGVYDLSENVPTGWQQESATCSDNSPPTAIDIAPGETVTCTFQNTKQDTIIVIKRAVGGNGAFAFTANIPGAATFDLTTTKGRAERVFENVPPGTYNIAESVPAGWTANVADPVCSNGDNASAITLAAGETVTCEFVNLKQDTLVVEKVSIGGDGSFAFNSPQLGGFGLNTSGGTATRTFANLSPGSYSITETVPAGWDPSGATCTNGNSPDALNLTPGASVTCTFTNTQRADLTLIKQSQGGDAGFDFTSATLGNFTLSTVGGTAQRVFADLTPGVYSLSESVPAGWDQTSATCTDGSTLNNIDLAPGESVTCTVVNVKRGSLTVVKQATGADATFVFTSTTLTPANFDLTTVGGTAQRVFADLTPGTYDLTENALTGWSLDSATCSDGSDPGSIGIAPGEDVTCTFANAQLDTIVVIKRAVGGDESFNFTATGAGLSNFSLTTSGGSAQQTFTGLAAGSYSITETVPAGWRTTTPDPVCSNGDNTSNLTLGNGETVVCVFINLKQDTLIIEKQSIGGDGVFDFTGDLGGFSLTTSGGTAQQIFTNLNPGTYAITETAQADWDLTDATCDNGTAAGNVTLPPGATVTCTYTNTQRATLTLIKQSVGGDAAFNFGSDIPGAASFALTTTNGTAQRVFDNLPPATYSVIEGVANGWDLTKSACSDGSTLGAIDLAPGEAVTCTIENTKRATLTVVKETNGADGAFAFSSPQLQDFSLTTSSGTAQRTFADLVPGVYGLSERSVSGWDQISATCSDGSNPTNIRLFPGADVTCTFRNNKRAALTIVKKSVGGDATFDFSGIGGGFRLTTRGGTATQTFADAAPGPYAIVETVPVGWDATGASCTNGDDPATLTLAPGDVVTCTFENTKRGSLTLVKKTTGGDGVFPFSSTSLVPASFALTTTGGTVQRAFANLVPGVYDLAETVPSGWRQESATCSVGSDPANISIGPGEDVTCTFENLKLDTIVVVKRAVGGDASFTFGSNLSAAGSFNLSTVNGSAQQSFSNLAPGTYSITETVPAGWTASVADPLCSNGDRADNVTLAAGETVVCVFVSLKQDTLVVEKVAVGGDANFGFTSPQLGAFGLNTSGGSATRAFTGLQAGTYSISETVPAGWVQSGATCDNSQTPDNLSLAPGATVTCTFTNTKLASLTVVKQTTGGDASFDFTSQALGNFSLSTSGGSAQRVFANLTPGSVSITETVPAGWDLTSFSCSDGSPWDNIDLAPGEDVTCGFVNTKRGSLTVIKQVNGSDVAFDFTSQTLGNFALTTVNGAAQRLFADLTPGTYDLSETVPAGWRQDSATCSDGSTLSAIDIAAGEDVTCTFTNTELDSIVVVKRTLGGDGSFDFRSSSLSPTSFSLSTVNGTAQQTFANLSPGTYDVAELVQRGWTQSDADPVCSNGDRASSIRLAAGETAVCVFENRKQDTLRVQKQTVGGDGVFDFTGDLGSFSLSTSGGVTTTAFANLNAGVYSVSESATTGWDLTAVRCDNGDSPSGVSLTPGTDVACTFENTQRGSLTIVKQTLGGDAAFAFTGVGLTPSSFSLTTVNGTAQQTFANLPPSTYAVTETVPAGWDLTSAICSDGSPLSAIDIAPGEDVTCTFSNTRRETKIYLPIIRNPSPRPTTLYLPIILKLASPVVYTTNFRNGVGGEWSSGTMTTTAPSGEVFLGEFGGAGREGATLSLSSLPAHSQVTVSLDLYILRSWDGNQEDLPAAQTLRAALEPASIDGTVGPDRWLLKNGDAVLFETSFSNIQSFTQAYPDAFGASNPAQSGASAVNSLGYTYQGTPMNATYRIERTFDHSGDSLTLTFEAVGLQIPEDESWGIDNITVTIE